MSRYVDAYEVTKALHEEVEQIDCGTTYAVPEGYIDLIVSRVPPADVEPIRHAYDMDEYTSLFECSNCGWMCDDTYCGNPCVGNTVTYNYCPNCGAKIDYKIGYGERKDGESDE